jgi:FkbM family methyltransferase
MPNPALYRIGTSDRSIWHNVVEIGEYKLPDMGPDDVCIDIGSNTGAATYAMLQKGAGKVIAFEPDPDNFLLYRKQLKQELKDGRCEIYPLAVVGGSGFSWRTFSGVVEKDGEINHGGAFLFSESGSDYGLGKYIKNRPFTVPCIGFDEIEIPEGMNRRLLKIDAEGSEWEILPQSRNVSEFQTLVGEYHPTRNNQCYELQNSLREFDWTFQPHPGSELGLFFAERK